MRSGEYAFAEYDFSLNSNTNNLNPHIHCIDKGRNKDYSNVYRVNNNIYTVDRQRMDEFLRINGYDRYNSLDFNDTTSLVTATFNDGSMLVIPYSVAFENGVSVECFEVEITDDFSTENCCCNDRDNKRKDVEEDNFNDSLRKLYFSR